MKKPATKKTTKRNLQTTELASVQGGFFFYVGVGDRQSGGRKD